MIEGEYENMHRITYGEGEYEGATFVQVCERCGRFVKADKMMRFQGGTLADRPNATCTKCGRTKMIFEGFL